jgi:hypothetical protein
VFGEVDVGRKLYQAEGHEGLAHRRATRTRWRRLKLYPGRGPRGVGAARRGPEPAS